MKISILSAVHNEERYIEEMISSVRSQTHEDWELIFVDDGSVDDTVQHIRSAASQDPRITLAASGAKIGKTAAFNKAFMASKGELIVLLAGDDRIPAESLAVRLGTITRPEEPQVGFFKLRSFSDDPTLDGMTLPRGKGTSSSGGVMILTRPLACQLFPIPEILPSEDLWLGYGAPALGAVLRESTVVLEYRMHAGNSNPRRLPFAEMNVKMSKRHEAWRLLAESSLPLRAPERQRLRALAQAEGDRRHGRTIRVLSTKGLSLISRMSLASMSDPRLYTLRSRFYGLFSGWQGQ